MVCQALRQVVTAVDNKHGLILEFVLQAEDFNAAGEASGKIKKILQQMGIKAEVIRRVAISAYEGEMNVIIHSVGGKLKARIFPEYTEIDIVDEGPGIADVKLAMQEGYSTAPDYIRDMGFGAGMGLPNMARCADDFNIQSQVGKGTQVFIRIRHF